MNTFLSPSEIKTLTGRVRPSAQVKFLTETLNIRAFVNAANQVVVYRAQLIDKFDTRQPEPAMPDFQAMDEVA